jgi:hypothetical protein
MKVLPELYFYLWHIEFILCNNMHHKNDIFYVPDFSHARTYRIHPYLHLYQSILIGVMEYHSLLDNSIFQRQMIKKWYDIRENYKIEY